MFFSFPFIKLLAKRLVILVVFFFSGHGAAASERIYNERKKKKKMKSKSFWCWCTICDDVLSIYVEIFLESLEEMLLHFGSLLHLGGIYISHQFFFFTKKNNTSNGFWTIRIRLLTRWFANERRCKSSHFHQKKNAYPLLKSSIENIISHI